MNPLLKFGLLAVGTLLSCLLLIDGFLDLVALVFMVFILPAYARGALKNDVSSFAPEAVSSYYEGRKKSARSFLDQYE